MRVSLGELRLLVRGVLSAAIVAMPWDPYLVLTGFSPLSTLWLITPVMVILAALVTLLDRAASIPQRTVLCLAMSLLVVGFSVVWSECAIERSAFQLVTLAYLIVQAGTFLFLARWAAYGPGRYASVLGWSVSALLMIGMLRGTVMHGTRIIPTEEYNPTWLGAYAATTCVLCVYLLTSRRRPFYWALLGGLGVATLLWTQSRNATLALVVAVATAAAVHAARFLGSMRTTVAYRRLVRPLGAVVVGGGLLVALATAFLVRYGLAPLDFTRFALLLSSDPYMATAGRTEIWTRMASAFSSPWGVGIGCFEPAFVNVYGYERLPHNQWLYTFGELGVLGLILLALGGAYAVVRGVSMGHAAGIGAIATWFFVPLMTVGNDVLFYQYWWAAVISAFIVSMDVDSSRRSGTDSQPEMGSRVSCGGAVQEASP